MSRLRFNWDEAVRHISSQCPQMAGFVAGCRKGRLRVHDDPDLFTALSRAIAYQQLSGKAAATIHGRFEALFAPGRPSPERTLGLGFDRLRSAGLSRAKALAIGDLAHKCLDGTVPGPRKLGRMGDEEVIRALCAVRGIGPWTAQMYLIFDLGRPDVMPAADLGVQKGVQRVYRMRRLPAPQEVVRRTRHLAPYRSAASWYFWRAAESPD